MQERPGRGVPPAGGPPRGRAAAVAPLVGADPTTVSDAHLAAAWAGRDPLAPGEVYRRYGAVLFGAAACLLDDRAVAADAVHDAFARADARVVTLDAPARLLAWLLAVVRAEAAQRSLHPPAAGWSPAPALPPAQWRTAAPLVADAETVWSAAAALHERDREALEFVSRGAGGTSDLAAVLGVPAQQAAVLVPDLRVRLEVSLGALLVARAGGEGCPELGAVLAGQGPAWTADLLVLVVRHQQDCMDCRAVRSRLLPAVPPVVPPADGPRHVPADPALRARVLATLGADADAEVVAHLAGTPWPVDAAPAGLSGRGWTWSPDGFPVQPPQAVRRVADVVAEAGALAAAEAAAFAAAAARSARPKRRLPAPAAAVLVAAPLLVGALVLVGVVRTGAGLPGDEPGRAPGVVVADGEKVRESSGTASPSPVAGTPRATAGASAPGAGTAGAGGGDAGAAGGAASPSAAGTASEQATGAPASQQDPGLPAAGPSDPPPGPGETTAGGSPTRMPASAPAADGASVSPDTVRTPGGDECTPLTATVTVPVRDADAVSGSVTWSNGRTTRTTPLAADGDALVAKVGPFQDAGRETLTITVSNAAGSDTVTRTLDVKACGHHD